MESTPEYRSHHVTACHSVCAASARVIVLVTRSSREYISIEHIMINIHPSHHLISSHFIREKNPVEQLDDDRDRDRDSDSDSATPFIAHCTLHSALHSH